MDEDEFPQINTGNGIDRDLSATANDRIKKAVIELRRLISAIEIFNKQSSEQTETMVKLTRWIVYLTVAMLVGLVIQIILVVV